MLTLLDGSDPDGSVRSIGRQHDILSADGRRTVSLAGRTETLVAIPWTYSALMSMSAISESTYASDLGVMVIGRTKIDRASSRSVGLGPS